ncbi:SpoIIE family protein phosphatase [uncultured Microscilla sp.]|uniref:SpoIIE family protein phosphatase n=1 Tax=uncultured Microscilla sp. TaxID=432653 RepID=UPI00262F7A4D|nr:SpoIIE family protein phosphatase [uncultured Microscilla sp.]
MTKWLQILLFILVITFSVHWVKAQTPTTDRWKKVKADKKGTLWVIYTNNEPFIKAELQGQPTGLEPDIIRAFVRFIKSHYQIDLQLRWKKFKQFKDCYKAIKQMEAGVIACAGFSITDQRKRELQFSKAYMPDIEILISSHNVPVFEDIASFNKYLPQLKVITIRNTTFEQNLKDLIKTRAFTNLTYSYIPNGEVMRDSCVNKNNFLAYTQLPNYIMMLQQGKLIQRQRLFNVVREGLALALPLKSDWKQPLDTFFAQPASKQLIKNIINKHFGNFATDLIIDAQKNRDDTHRENQMVSMEQKFQELLIQKTKEQLKSEKLQTRIALLALAALILLFGVLGWFLYNREKIKKIARQELARKNAEIAAQAASIKESYQKLELISDLGKLVIANLSIEDIIKTVYQQVLSLMPTEEFGIGIYDPVRKSLVYEVYFSKGKRMPVFSLPVSQNDRLTLKCFTLKQEIVLSDLPNEYTQYLDSLDAYQPHELLNSMICLPLVAGDQAIGIINVQHSAKNAYGSQHVSIFRNLANYAIIAIQNAKVFKQLESQKNDITASINYAKQIQDAMLPGTEIMQAFLPNIFVLFKPRDIVSGDFYYFAANADKSKCVLAAIDCTGHGVPGAFMSLIGNDILNSIIEQEGIIDANLILDKLHTGVYTSLRQDSNSNRDGMDISLCVIDKATQTLQFAGAMSSLVYVQNGELKRLVGDKMPIGGEQRERNRQFQKQVLDISIPTTLYLYSDGYQDQFGGEHNRKFMAPRFRELLYSIHQTPVTEQKKVLESTLKHWKQNNDQLDDILVIGVKV